MEEPTAEAVMESQPSQEAVYVFNAQSGLPNRVTLTLAGEPVLFPSGYVRLAGVVVGGRPVACLEMAGRGLALREGEELNDHRVARIANDRVLLERSK